MKLRETTIARPFGVDAELPLGRPRRLTALLKALRLYQWTKNGLLFVPLVLAHKITDVASVLDVLAAFVAFGACASGVYILNDLVDLDADRKHPYKQSRPFAAGHLPIRVGLVLAPSCAVAGLLWSLALLPPAFTASLLVYLALTTAYSFALKRVAVLDVFVLAGLFTLRVLAGGVAVAVPVSPWLLAFSMFFFLSLALVKRYAELRVMQERKQTEAAGRNYRVSDMDLLRGIGTASGYLSVLVVALYTNSSEVAALYARPGALWLVSVVLLYWITRMWFLAHRAELDEDAILFTVKDPPSYVVGVLIAAVIFLAATS
jgi:4-hydroxybenzoate polyprenyltransferase